MSKTTVEYHNWSRERGQEREPGARIESGGHFVWIPLTEIMQTADALVGFIDRHRAQINNNADTGN